MLFFSPFPSYFLPIGFLEVPITKELIVQVLRKVGVRVATKSVAKYIPILGSALAATVSFGAMKIVGNSHVDDCYDVAKKAILAINESSKNFEKAIA
jgi:hypothetical protein